MPDPKDVLWVYSPSTQTVLTALNNDCTNVALAAPGVWGATSLNFDKANGAGNTIYAIVYGVPLITSLYHPNIGPNGKIYWSIKVSSIAAVAYSFVRLGNDASNYCEWRFIDTSHVATKFTYANAVLGECYTLGSPDMSAIDYMQIGVTFDAESDTLADILIDGVWIEEV